MEQLKLNMIPNGVNPVFHASQYDKGRQIRFVLDETLSGAKVTVSYRAKDGTEHGNVQMSVSGNTITDTIPEEVLTDYGIVEGEVNIDGIGSLNFFVEVEKDAYDGGSIITQTASGAIATFNTNMVKAFKSLKSDINPVQSGTGTPSPDNVRPISGFSALNVTLADGNMQTVDTKTVNFGQTVYGGVADVTNGKLTITHKVLSVDNNSAFYSSGNSAYLNITDAKIVNEYASAISDKYEYNTWSGATNGDNNYFTLYQNTAWSNARLAFNRNGLSLADFITSLTNNPIQVVYELATPIEITTTPEYLTAISGENNVYGDTNGDTTVEYYIEV